MSVSSVYLESIKKRFLSYKELGDKTFEQLSEEDMHWRNDESSNSIATIVKHMSGNMLSRFTDFLSSDGEKPWRHRDAEFEEDDSTKAAVLNTWNKGWERLMNTLQHLTENDLEKIIYIRGEPHTVIDALNRQLSHYPYHVGQIVYIAKLRKGSGWKSLSIPKGQSGLFNQEMFSKK